MGKCYLLAGFLVLALAVSAGADFRAVGGIAVPDGPGWLTGLDSEGDTLFAVAREGDCTGYCSYMYLLDAADGQIGREGHYLNFQPDCMYDPSLLISGAACGGSAYWVGDECGDVVKIRWTPDSLEVLESFMMPEGDMGPHYPAGLAYRWPNLYVLDPPYREIRVFDDYYDMLTWQIPLPVQARQPTSIAFIGDNYLVSSAATDSVFEIDYYGQLIAVHWLEGFGDRTAVGMAFVGERLYVASPYDSILIFEESSYEEPVPPGDEVVIEIVPGGVTVTFDSVSTGGTMTAEVSQTDSCPPPEGVSFFDVFTEIATDANFDYAAEVVLATAGDLPPGVDPELVRVFVRPSGACGSPGYRDITVGPDLPVEGPEELLTTNRVKSEDYEFSVFALAEDHRPPAFVVNVKFARLEAAIDGGQSSIPGGVFDQINALLDQAHDAYCRGHGLIAAALADSIATIVRSTPDIPHTYLPGVEGSNLAGRLIAEAHTLAFSLRFLEFRARQVACTITPRNLTFAYDGLVKVCLEIPEGLGGGALSQDCFFLNHKARAIPESVAILDCDGDGMSEIYAVLRVNAVKAALDRVGESTARLTCLLGGFQVNADAAVTLFGVDEDEMSESGLTKKDPTIPASEQAAPFSGGADRFRVSPNPSTSSFAVELVRDGRVPAEVAIYSVTGEVVKVLHHYAPSADRLMLVWNADNEEGRRVSPGAYFAVLREEGRTEIRKVVLQR